MRSIPPALAAGFAAGTGKPLITAYIGYIDGTGGHALVPWWYKLTGTTLEFEIPYVADMAGDHTGIWLNRGLTIAGTDYAVTTGRFYILSQTYTEHGTQIVKGGLFPNKYYSATGDISYQTALENLCTAFLKTAEFKAPAEAWLAYQMLPDGTNLVMQDANQIAPFLQQKRLIKYCDKGDVSAGQEIRFYCADVMGASEATIAVKEPITLEVTALRNRQFIWTDENGADYTDGTATDPIHNLGYMESTDSPPARNSPSVQIQAIIRPDLRLMDGDVITLTTPQGWSATFFAQITEQYDRAAKEPKWRTIIQANPIFGNTDGGDMPPGIASTSNYTHVNTSRFTRALSAKDSTVQTAFDRIDDKQLTLIADTWLGSADGASLDIQNIPQTFRHLRLLFTGRSATAADHDNVQLRFNNDSAANYDSAFFYTVNTALAAGSGPGLTWAYAGACPGAGAARASQVATLDISITHYRDTNREKSGFSCSGIASGTAAHNILWNSAFAWRSTAAITRITLLNLGGANFKRYSRMTLYGF